MNQDRRLSPSVIAGQMAFETHSRVAFRGDTALEPLGIRAMGISADASRPHY